MKSIQGQGSVAMRESISESGRGWKSLKSWKETPGAVSPATVDNNRAAAGDSR